MASGARQRSTTVGANDSASPDSPMWSGGSSESTVATTAMTDVERGTGMARHKAAVPGAAAMYDQAAAVDASRDSLTDPASSDLDGDAASDPTEGVASRSISRTGTQDATLRMEAGRRRGDELYTRPDSRSESSVSSSSASPARLSASSDNSSELGNTSTAGGAGTSIHVTRTDSPVPVRRPGQPQFEGFWQVRSLDDLRPMKDSSHMLATQRRADPAGGFVSPLKALTAYLHHTYHLVNPAFNYELSFNPRRVLTKPSKPVYNEGRDNEESDYILYVNDCLGSEEGHRYLILDVLGQGTFGQVVKCQNMTTHEIVAVKVIKNKTAYFNQSMMEVTILETLNQHWDPRDTHNILRLQDTFIHAKHLCLVFELLSSNLYELIKQNSFRGLSTSLVRVFTTQLLDALSVLKEARLIHCDLKPENILLRTLQAPSIKLVDFGSACHEQQTVYTYIQSRFYRSPEVLLGLPYSSAIDMWSLGCIAVELFLGLPIFPGTSEYNQVCRIVDMLGLPPQFMLEQGRQTNEFFNVHTDAYGRRTYRLKPLEQYSHEHHVQEQPSKQYFPGSTLPEIIRLVPLSRRSGRAADMEKEMANRTAFIDFVSGLLNINPYERWTPQQAKMHPFITGEPLTRPWQPTAARPATPPPSAASSHTVALQGAPMPAGPTYRDEYAPSVPVHGYYASQQQQAAAAAAAAAAETQSMAAATMAAPAPPPPAAAVPPPPPPPAAVPPPHNLAALDAPRLSDAAAASAPEWDAKPAPAHAHHAPRRHRQSTVVPTTATEAYVEPHLMYDLGSQYPMQSSLPIHMPPRPPVAPQQGAAAAAAAAAAAGYASASGEHSSHTSPPVPRPVTEDVVGSSRYPQTVYSPQQTGSFAVVVHDNEPYTVPAGAGASHSAISSPSTSTYHMYGGAAPPYAARAAQPPDSTSLPTSPPEGVGSEPYVTNAAAYLPARAEHGDAQGLGAVAYDMPPPPVLEHRGAGNDSDILPTFVAPPHENWRHSR